MIIYLFSNPVQCPQAHRDLGRWVERNGGFHYVSLKELSPGYEANQDGTTEHSCLKVSEILGIIGENQTPQITYRNFDKIIEAIRSQASVFFAGGDSLVYLKKLDETGVGSENTIKLLKGNCRYNPYKLVMGASAGAMIFGKSVDAFASWSYWSKQRGQRPTFGERVGLGFINAQIIPHYGNAEYPAKMVDATLDRYFKEESPPANTKLVLMEENAALVIDTTRYAIGMLGRIHLRDWLGQRLLLQEEMLKLLPEYAPLPVTR